MHGVNAASLPDFAWRDWAGAQTERVLDSMDIDYMRLVKRREDANFKTSVWDLSQNVDRSDPTKAKLGICPCLTPSLCAYVTNQGRPVVGVETLALQGIPIDLLLTRETEENLTSLSGNAMSTTVVGSALLAALLSLPMGVLGRIGIVDSKAHATHLDTNYPVQHHSTRGSDRHANVVRSQVLVREPLNWVQQFQSTFKVLGHSRNVSFTPLPRAPSGASARLSGLILRPRFSTALPVVTALARHAQANQNTLSKSGLSGSGIS